MEINFTSSLHTQKDVFDILPSSEFEPVNGFDCIITIPYTQWECNRCGKLFKVEGKSYPTKCPFCKQLNMVLITQHGQNYLEIEINKMS